MAIIAGRLLVGILAKKLNRKRAATIASLVQVGVVLWLIWAQELWMLYLFALFYGFTQGGMSTALTAVAGDTFCLTNIGKILGILEVGFAIGAAIGPVIGGFIFDTSNSYSFAFFDSGRGYGAENPIYSSNQAKSRLRFLNPDNIKQGDWRGKRRDLFRSRYTLLKGAERLADWEKARLNELFYCYPELKKGVGA